MQNKILKTLLGALIALNMWGFFYHEHEVKVYKDQISKLQDNVETKSTKIAKLGDTINLQNEMIVKQKRVIDIRVNEISELEKQNKKLIAKNHAITIHKSHESRKTNTNFNKGSKGDDVGSRITVEATAYIANCSEGCTGTTATGVNVSNTIYYHGYRVIAVDTSVIPLNSLVRVDTANDSFTAMAIDKGGAIVGHKIDVLVGSTSRARQFGRQKATLTILKRGNN